MSARNSIIHSYISIYLYISNYTKLHNIHIILHYFIYSFALLFMLLLSRAQCVMLYAGNGRKCRSNDAILPCENLRRLAPHFSQQNNLLLVPTQQHSLSLHDGTLKAHPQLVVQCRARLFSQLWWVPRNSCCKFQLLTGTRYLWIPFVHLSHKTLLVLAVLVGLVSNDTVRLETTLIAVPVTMVTIVAGLQTRSFKNSNK